MVFPCRSLTGEPGGASEKRHLHARSWDGGQARTEDPGIFHRAGGQRGVAPGSQGCTNHPQIDRLGRSAANADFVRDLADFKANHLYRSLKELRIGELLQYVLILTFRYRLRIPDDISLMLKALATVEGVAQWLDPDFDMISHAAPYIRKICIWKMAPGRMAVEALFIVGQGFNFIKQILQDVLKIT